jgi:hypothetical protein
MKKGDDVDDDDDVLEKTSVSHAPVTPTQELFLRNQNMYIALSYQGKETDSHHNTYCRAVPAGCHTF